MKYFYLCLLVLAGAGLYVPDAHASQVVQFGPHCKCYDIDNGDEPTSPSGTAVQCAANAATAGYTNLTMPDGNGSAPSYFREYVCGNPPGSAPVLINGGVVMMSYFNYQCRQQAYGPATSIPSWLSQFWGGPNFSFCPYPGKMIPFKPIPGPVGDIKK